MRTIRFVDNIEKILGKTTFVFSIGIFIVCACFTLFFFMSNWWYPEFNGSYNLGKNIYMIDWDGGGRILVRGTSIEGNTCYGGERLIPTYENQYDSIGNIVENVVDVGVDENWIIAKTENKVNLQRKYYIIDKSNITDEMAAEEIIKNRIISFVDSIEFAEKCSNDNISTLWCSNKKSVQK